nr:cytochrome C oxidase 6B [Viscum album]
MANVEGGRIQTLSEQYALKEKAEGSNAKLMEATNETSSGEITTEKSEDFPSGEVTTEASGEALSEVSGETITEAAAEVTTKPTNGAGDENMETNSAAGVDKNEANHENDQQEASDNQEVKKGMMIETAPVDFRFPTTNQTRHCYTRYIEYHRCIAAKGEDSTECPKFKKYYRSLCPTEWTDKWDEQRETGTFPGPI